MAVTAPLRLFGAAVRPLQAFLRLEAAGGVVLLACAAAALSWANLAPESYRATFDRGLVAGELASPFTFSVRDLVNEGLMTVFFFVVGMEIKRELVVGELCTVRRAVLPAIAALGGMVVPAAIYAALNLGGPGAAGWGIPMATDIAFCIGVLALLKDRVPRGLVVFITALAIFDDIGGILVIALFYGHGLQGSWLLAAVVITLCLLAMNRAFVTSGFAYALGGACLWTALHRGGIHATIAGVVLGMMIPARARRLPRDVLRELADYLSTLGRRNPDEELEGAEILAIEEKLEDMEAPVQRYIHALHPFVAFFVMPCFALANSGVIVTGIGLPGLFGPVALGAGLGLFAGKQIGIFAFTALAVRLGLASMPGGASRAQLWGASIVAGIGFTVALFIAALAFPVTPRLLDQAKAGILAGSLVAGLAGYAVLRLLGKPATTR